jgi:hypothetical protein
MDEESWRSRHCMGGGSESDEDDMSSDNDTSYIRLSSRFFIMDFASLETAIAQGISL